MQSVINVIISIEQSIMVDLNHIDQFFIINYVKVYYQDRRSKNESGGAEPYIPYIPLMIEKKIII